MNSVQLAALAGLASIAAAHAAPLLGPGDPVVAIDTDVVGISRSDYSLDESPARALDGLDSTAYGNRARQGSGLIVTPQTPVAVQSFVITTAPDSPAGDPASWQIAGTDDPVTSTDNSLGDQENWTVIAEGTFTTSLPDTRQTASAPVSFSNAVAYKSYRIHFPALKNAAAAATMHFSGIQFYPGQNAAGPPVLTAADAVKAVHIPNHVSSSPEGAEVDKVIDGVPATKYVNDGELNTGFIVTPVSGPKVIRSLRMTTANDLPAADPVKYEIHGTNDPVVSAQNSTGTAESWTLVALGQLTPPVSRLTEAPVAAFNNTSAFRSWRVSFPAVRSPLLVNSMQLGEVQFFENADGTGEGVLSPGDPIVAVQVPKTESAYRKVNEDPSKLLDGNAATKYKNFGRRNTGFIITPASGGGVLRSFVLTTGDDLPANDPASYELYGTNDVVTSADNSDGQAESWVLISRGKIALPDARRSRGAAVDVVNAISYTSYKWVAIAVKDTATTVSMQLSGAEFYTAPGGAGTPMLSPADRILAIQKPVASSSSPSGEPAKNAIDGTTLTKYLNFGKLNTGFIVTPAAGARAVAEIRLSTANDSPVRDPAAYELSGTNDPVLSTAHSEGTGENWTLVARGKVTLPSQRFAETVVPVSNGASFTSWRLVFPEVKNEASADAMQISEVSFRTAGQEAFLSQADDIFPIQELSSQSASPSGQEVANAVDGNPATKYVNTGGNHSGFIVTPSAGTAAVYGFTIITADDLPARDPAGWEISGTNDPIVSGNHSEGTTENWTVVATGIMALPAARLTAAIPVSFANSTPYRSWRFRVLSVRDPATADAMQFADIQFESGPAVPPPGEFKITDFALTGSPATAGQLSWVSVEGVSYTVQASTDLNNWSSKDTITATGVITSLSVPLTGDLAGKPRLYFRVLRN